MERVAAGWSEGLVLTGLEKGAPQRQCQGKGGPSFRKGSGAREGAAEPGPSRATQGVVEGHLV